MLGRSVFPRRGNAGDLPFVAQRAKWGARQGGRAARIQASTSSLAVDRAGGNMTHGLLSQGGDGQAWIDPQVGRDH